MTDPLLQQTFKGGIGQMIGLIASTLIGPSRYALLVANLLALLLFLAILAIASPQMKS
jgi:hypothetical protein